MIDSVHVGFTVSRNLNKLDQKILSPYQNYSAHLSNHSQNLNGKIFFHRILQLSFTLNYKELIIKKM